MKKLIACFVSGLLSLSLFGLDIFSYVSLPENVKSVTCSEYSITTKFGDYFKTPAGKITRTFDANGNETESAAYTARGLLEDKMLSEYDDSGNIKSQTALNKAEDVMWKTEFVYKNGVKTESDDYLKDGSLKGKTFYTYKDGLLADETGYDSKGALIWKTIYKYDASGRIEKESVYFGNGLIDEDTTYTYRDDGKIDSIAKMSVIDGVKQEVFRYSSDGVLSEITTYDADNKVAKRLIIKYDAGKVSKISDYVVAEKFGTIVNELVYIAEYAYEF